MKLYAKIINASTQWVKKYLHTNMREEAQLLAEVQDIALPYKQNKQISLVESRHNKVGESMIEYPCTYVVIGDHISMWDLYRARNPRRS